MYQNDLKNVIHLKILRLLVLFFSAPSLVPCHEFKIYQSSFQISNLPHTLKKFLRTPMIWTECGQENMGSETCQYEWHLDAEV